MRRAFLVGSLLLVIGCGSAQPDDDARGSTGRARQDEQAIGEIEIHTSSFRSIDQMLARSDLVATIEIIAVQDGLVTGEDHASRRTQVIAVAEVDESFKGQGAGTPVDIWIGIRERSLETGQEGLSFSSTGYVPKVGDRVLVGLVQDDRYANTYGLESNDSFFVMDDGRTVFREEIATSNSAARAVRSKPVNEVVAMLR